MAGANRLSKEYREVMKNLSESASSSYISSAPTADLTDSIILYPTCTSPLNLYLWTAHIVGPQDTPYYPYRFTLRISVPTTYPHRPPHITFVTPIAHPNIHFKSGEICMDILKEQWTPIWTIEATVRAIGALLASPQADSPLNCDVGNVLRANDVTAYNSLVNLYAVEHAQRVNVVSQHQRTAP